ncbi:MULTISPECIES: AAA family ATPase [unclassified Nitrospina]|uniref:ATP-binding protein n=1 Tax=unclassified Nitrospina TaxID=2638683 RepID=UPI003F9A28DC
MQLRALHIKRFGAFKDTSVTGLRPGLNLLYGENEAGKTTLLQFVRWALFGEDSMYADQYAPEDGGKQEGSLECESANGEAVAILRSVQSKQKTQVSITTPSRTVGEQPNLNPFLGYIPAGLFKNTYAFTIEELQQLDFVKDEEVKQRIVGAGLGLGAVSLAGVKGALAEHRDRLFRQRGKTQTINALTAEIKKREKEIQEMQKDLVQYDALHAEIESLTQKRAALREPLAEAQHRVQRLKALSEVYPRFVDWVDSENALEAMHGVPDLSEPVVEQFHALRREWASLKKQHDETQQEVERLQKARDAIEINDALLQLEAEVKQLTQSHQSVSNILKDIDGLRRQRSEKKRVIEQNLNRIGEGWNAVRLKSFQKIDELQARARRHRSELESAAESISKAQALLDSHFEHRARESARPSVPAGVSVFLFLFAGLSIAGGVAAWFAGFLWGVGIAVLGTVLAAAAAVWVRRQSHSVQAEDPLERHYRDDVEQAQAERARYIKDWQGWLAERGFHTGLDANQLEDVMRRIERTQDLLRERDELDARIESMEADLQKGRSLVERAASALPGTKLKDNLLVNMEWVADRYEAQRARQEERRQINASLEEHVERLERLKAVKETPRRNLDRLILEAGAKDEAGFEELVSSWKRACGLKQKADRARQDVQSRMGVGEAFDAVVKELRDAEPTRLDSERIASEEQVDELVKQIQEVDQKLGGCKKEQERLASNDALFEAQSRVGMLKQRLDRAGRDWAVATLTLSMLDRSLKTYQETHQPAVYRAASDWFGRITGGAYEAVRYQMESDVVDVRTASGDFKPVEHLSRGTREQLYLALRLALIQEYEKESEPLPVLMDDVWVNFDDARRDRFVEVLVEFAKDRQVIVLSCHSASRELCLRHGAYEVPLPSA